MSESFATLWTVARQAPLSTGFPRCEYWSGLHEFGFGHVVVLKCPFPPHLVLCAEHGTDGWLAELASLKKSSVLSPEKPFHRHLQDLCFRCG